MAITPPSERIWWRQPIAKIELIWIFVAFTWGLIMFFMMIWWHGVGEQNLSNEAYRIKPQAFAQKAQVMIDEYTVREESGFPVVHPPAGSDIYLIARLWQWWPILELEKDQSYRASHSEQGVSEERGARLAPEIVETIGVPSASIPMNSGKAI